MTSNPISLPSEPAVHQSPFPQLVQDFNSQLGYSSDKFTASQCAHPLNSNQSVISKHKLDFPLPKIISGSRATSEWNLLSYDFLLSGFHPTQLRL